MADPNFHEETVSCSVVFVKAAKPEPEICSNLEQKAKELLAKLPNKELSLKISTASAFVPTDPKLHSTKLFSLNCPEARVGLGFRLGRQVETGRDEKNRRRDGISSRLAFFECLKSKPLTTGMSTQDLVQFLDYIALDFVKIDTFQTPSNWAVGPRTPVSSFKDGVKILVFDSKRITLQVETSCFAISGKQTDIGQIPCGQPAPKDSYFQVREDFKLKLSLDAAIQL